MLNHDHYSWFSRPNDEINEKNIRGNIKKQISQEIYDRVQIYHLRGGIDYSKLSFQHKNINEINVYC